MDPVGELARIVAELERDAIAYAVCGGLALAIHGVPRMTDDIDMLVRPEDVARALAAAKRAGFDIPAKKMLFGARTPSPREIHRVSTLDPATNRLIALDLLVVTNALSGVWDARIQLPWGAGTIDVVSRDGLIAMKRLAGRGQDLVDIARLEGTYDEDPA